MDVDAMKPGLDFVKQIDEHVSKCDVVLAIIGPGWLSAVDKKGRRKLDLPQDFVRVELAAALKRDIPVIPVLVDGTAMPAEEDLPDELKSLPHRHALELRHSRFSSDSEAVVRALREIVRRPWRSAWIVGAAAAIALLSLVAGPVIWHLPDRGGPAAPVVAAAKQAAIPASTTPDVPSGAAAVRRDRIAVVIGNSKYPAAGQPLKTPIGDARLMASGLSLAGFDAVVSGEDLTADAMRRKLEQFYGHVKPHSIVLLFFSGYAIQTDRQSYLIPVDADIWSEADVARNGFSLESILGEINDRGASIQITLLDASRRNPFEKRFRSFSAGLAPVNSPTGALIMYSVALSSVENDNANGNSDHSLFVTELLKNVGVPNLSAEEALNRTRRAIRSATHSEQVPWLSSSLAEDFTLAPSPEMSR
jgi:Caspase domain/TIR domain